MNKRFAGIGVLGLAIIVLGLASFAYAKGQPPQGREYPFGTGMMNGYGNHDFASMGN